MHYTYILRSIPSPSQTYIGQTSNLKVRLAIHDSNQSPHTSKFSPWTLEFYSAFKNKETAIAFEKYLKSHSGKAFAKKHL
jgi:predicted GIY-YIG superfamily endonuclease